MKKCCQMNKTLKTPRRWATVSAAALAVAASVMAPPLEASAGGNQGALS
jgi:hypothetical protein